jgi:hypothetical protein
MLRLLILLLAALGVGAAVFDFQQRGALRFSAVGELWFRFSPDTYQVVEPAISRHVSAFLWDPVLLTVMTAPAAPLFLGLAAGLLMLRRMFA